MAIAIRPLTALLATALLAGCGSSPPETFHALTRYASEAAPPASGAERAYGVLIGPVTVPDAVNRPQLVIRTGASRLDIREQQRWAGPLPADIALALAEDLAPALPQAYVYSQLRSPANTQPPRFRVALDVQRFESRLRGDEAGSVIETAWVVTDVATERKSVCRTLTRAPLQGGGYDALVAAHQAALTVLAERVAGVLTQMASGRTAFTVPAGTVCQR